MWFERKREPVSDIAETDHWTEEDMKASAYATPEGMPILFASLDAMDDDDLDDLAKICTEETLAPEICVPCKAMVLLAVRSQEDDGSDMPLLEETLNTPPPWKHPWEDVPAPTREETDSAALRDLLVTQVDELRNTVIRAFDPAKAGVKMGFDADDVAILVVAAKYYVEQSDRLASSGFTQDDGQRAIIERAREVVRRVTPDA